MNNETEFSEIYLKYIEGNFFTISDRSADKNKHLRPSAKKTILPLLKKKPIKRRPNRKIKKEIIKAYLAGFVR